jgi:outer membrane protein assembly factor BamB
MLTSSAFSPFCFVLLGTAILPVLGCGRTDLDILDTGAVADAGDMGSLDAGPAQGLQRGAPWPMFGQSPSLRGRSTAVGPESPTVKWFFPASVTAQPAVAADGTIYFGTSDGSVVSLRSDGSVKWKYAGAAGQIFGGTPAIRGDGSVVVGAFAGPQQLGQLVALSSTGALLWTYDTERSANEAPPSASIGDDGTIYFSVAYHLYAVHPDGSAAWQADAGDEYAIVPAIGPSGAVYVAGQYGLQAFTPGGQALWAFGPCAGLVSECTSQAAVADDGTIVTTVATLSQSPAYLLAAVGPAGTPAWSLGLSAQGVGFAIGTDGTIFAPAAFGARTDLESVGPGGQDRWATVLAGASGADAPVIDGAGTLYVGTTAWAEGALCGLPCEEVSGAGLQAIRADGTAAWVFLPETAFATPAIGTDGTLYAAAFGGHHSGIGLYAIGP